MPGPRQFPRPSPGSPVWDMNSALGRAALPLVQRATRHERKSSWHAAIPHPRRRPIRRTSSPGMSPTRVTRASGPASERRGPPRPQGPFASTGSGADQWPDRPTHAAGRRKEGTGRLAPGLRSLEAAPLRSYVHENKGLRLRIFLRLEWKTRHMIWCEGECEFLDAAT